MTQRTLSLAVLTTIGGIGLLVGIFLIFTGIWRPGVSEPVRAYQRGLAELDPKNDKERLGDLWQAASDADRSFEWKMPIAFYGVVVDERGTPVEGATIQLDWNDTSRKGTSMRVITTDTQGKFSLAGVKGKTLLVKVSKDGYYTPRVGNQFDFEYAAYFERHFHRPDPRQPVVFHLRKKQPAEPLVHRDLEILLTDSGVPTRLRLLTGKVGDSGDFEIQKWKSAEQERLGLGYVFDWRVVIRIPSGGLIETEEEMPFSAPSTGYRPELEFNLSRSLGKKWTRFLTRKAYILFGDGKYGRIEIKVSGTSGFARIEYWINPSGSRNLEYDPNKDITEQFNR